MKLVENLDKKVLYKKGQNITFNYRLGSETLVLKRKVLDVFINFQDRVGYVVNGYGSGTMTHNVYNDELVK